MKAIIVPAGEGRKLDCGVFRARILDRGGATEGRLGCMEFDVNPRSSPPPPHIHRTLVESFYILEGEIEFIVDGTPHRAASGTFAQIPAGAAHTYRNPGDGPLKFLVFFLPSTFVGFFEEFEALVQSGRANPVTNVALLNQYDTEAVRP